jgi:AcrR family transcriptional regulator
MAKTTRNADATKDRILEAAMAEFSAHGIAGARVDRIARAAKCNKNLIYIYFQDKETLFATVLQKHLARVYDETRFTPEDLPAYAVKIFDFAMAHPDLFRLMAWFALEHKTAIHAMRTEARDAKVEQLKKAQTSGHIGKTFPPVFLLTAVLTLATAWSAANPFGPVLDPEALKRPAALRRSIAEAVKRLTAP